MDGWTDGRMDGRIEGPSSPGRWLCSRAPPLERLWIHSRFGAAGGASAHPGAYACWIPLVDPVGLV